MSLPRKAKVVFFLVLIFPIVPFVSSRPLNGVEPIARTRVHAIWVRHVRAPVPPSAHSLCTCLPRSRGGHYANLP
ncbi:hypothetical protein PVL29_021932 [Vitis rotundifolia]|uniref:Secreted protein n=1 Tax=Vitis rotundifolia TaxID=103349 RepID=A0AA38YU03_VITRO|nr:hypothetical protein PVL29_021932 [Vitis rotundifolia]